MKTMIYNLRPYSWGDVAMIGIAASAVANGTLRFGIREGEAIACLLALWCFYQLALEQGHGYQVRGPVPQYAAAGFLLLSIGTCLITAIKALIPLTVTVLLTLLYLEKNRSAFGALVSPVVRGTIQAGFVVTASALVGLPNAGRVLVLASAACAMLIARALTGDIRDMRHNRQAGKITVPVRFGYRTSALLAEASLLSASSLIIGIAGFVPAIPLLLIAAMLPLLPNGYVAHQLMVLTTMFTLAAVACSFDGCEGWVVMLYAGVFLNQVFYPVLARKSNPCFVQPNELSFIMWRHDASARARRHYQRRLDP
ncbi:MAG: hypothetical protein ABIC95_04070 [archaeon]